jgi:hypothetical protein
MPKADSENQVKIDHIFIGVVVAPTIARRARLARDVLHDGDGALADECDRHRMERTSTATSPCRVSLGSRGRTRWQSPGHGVGQEPPTVLKASQIRPPRSGSGGSAIDRLQEHEQIPPLCRGQLCLNRGHRGKPRPMLYVTAIGPQPEPPEIFNANVPSKVIAPAG